MTAYADYKFYTDVFFGKAIPAEEFARYALLATQYVNSVTFGRINADFPIDEAKMACCAVAEIYYMARDADSRTISGIASEKVGDYSVSYSSASKETEKSVETKLYSTAKLWLSNTGLMFRGCG